MEAFLDLTFQQTVNEKYVLKETERKILASKESFDTFSLQIDKFINQAENIIKGIIQKLKLSSVCQYKVSAALLRSLFKQGKI